MSARPNPRLRRVPVSAAGLRVQTRRSEEQIARILTLGEYWAAQRTERSADVSAVYVTRNEARRASADPESAADHFPNVADSRLHVGDSVELHQERDSSPQMEAQSTGVARALQDVVGADALAGEPIRHLQDLDRGSVTDLERLSAVEHLGHSSSPSLVAGAPDTPRSAARSVGEPTSAAVPLAAGTVGTPTGEGPIAPSPVEQIDAALAATARATGDVPPTPRTVGPYKHTPFYDGSCMILGPSNEQIATTKAPKAAFTVVDALNAAYHRGLAEGGTR